MMGGHKQVRRVARTSLITDIFEITVDVSELNDDDDDGSRNYDYGGGGLDK
jgi:hypothetical protein